MRHALLSPLWYVMTFCFVALGYSFVATPNIVLALRVLSGAIAGPFVWLAQQGVLGVAALLVAIALVVGAAWLVALWRRRPQPTQPRSVLSAPAGRRGRRCIRPVAHLLVCVGHEHSTSSSDQRPPARERSRAAPPHTPPPPRGAGGRRCRRRRGRAGRARPGRRLGITVFALRHGGAARRRPARAAPSRRRQEPLRRAPRSPRRGRGDGDHRRLGRRHHAGLQVRHGRPTAVARCSAHLPRPAAQARPHDRQPRGHLLDGGPVEVRRRLGRPTASPSRRRRPTPRRWPGRASTSSTWPTTTAWTTCARGFAQTQAALKKRGRGLRRAARHGHARARCTACGWP